MDRRLYEASLRGDVRSLMVLLEEDELAVLDKLIIRDFYGTTPLHIAALRSHVDFAVKLLSLKPEFASEPDSEGFYPLHLASVKKNVDVVKVLLGADSDICIATDQDGRTPLHLAAMKGRVEIMKVLIQTRPEAIQVLSEPRETILHLCVKHNRLESLKFLVEYLVRVEAPIGDQEESNVFVNSKDNDGNTIFHLAVARRQMKMIKYLVNNNIGIELNALNNKGFTALDILTNSIETRGLKDIEIGDLLRDAGVLSRVSKQQIGESWIDNHDQTEEQPQQVRNTIGRQTFDHYDSWLKEKQNTLIVVASLIATMGFQAGTNPTGGVWGGDGNEFPTESKNVTTYEFPMEFLTDGNSTAAYKYAGTSIMAYNDVENYSAYMSFNTIGFVASLSIILLLISGLRHVRRKVFVGLLIVVLWVSITCMALSYVFALYALLPKNEKGYYLIPKRIQNTLRLWVVLMGVVVFAHFIHWIKWLLRKLGILKQEEAALAYVRNGY